VKAHGNSRLAAGRELQTRFGDALSVPWERQDVQYETKVRHYFAATSSIDRLFQTEIEYKYNAFILFLGTLLRIIGYMTEQCAIAP
jgi:hypothetical protein